MNPDVIQSLDSESLNMLPIYMLLCFSAGLSLGIAICHGMVSCQYREALRLKEEHRTAVETQKRKQQAEARSADLNRENYVDAFAREVERVASLPKEHRDVIIGNIKRYQRQARQGA